MLFDRRTVDCRPERFSCGCLQIGEKPELTCKGSDVNQPVGWAFLPGGVVCVHCSAGAHPDDQGAIVHEMVHVVQQYRGRGNPGWLVEGIADYFRWFVYEPPSKQPHPDLSRASYRDSYRTTAAFLN